MDPTAAADLPTPCDSNEHFLLLFTRHEPELRAFVRTCVPCRDDVDEVMQRVSLVAWRKFSQLEERAQFASWACVIARFEILKYRRSKARDRLVLDEDIMERLGAEGIPELPLRHRQLSALDGCVAKLPDERRQLIIDAYTAEGSIRALSTKMGRTEGSLYQLIARIRQELLRCVERSLAEEIA
jgi:RNA polymerase sigma-70 factor, ECF subfamily